MDDERKNLQLGGNDEQPPYTFSDERTKKKVRRHIRDIKDVITENDIKNAKIPGKEKAVKPTRKKDEKPVDVHDAPGKPVTPWDILEEE
jgi:hypothetical protein